MTKTKSPRCQTCHDVIVDEPGAKRPRWRPFCSERCRLVDLSKWLGGEHAIPGEPVSPNIDEE